ncbi:protein AAR2 homolog [Diorhabda carinulata]|uniref:protein AAR2 homolog n=1 Tax=Diorhabda carinulata TaxID=1163345 RepID=UPI0025A00DAD|nr:protein AAR2 homolog [Diorhabda carinulata]XP_057651977.1 protein AAR2 homolog [Diorhabda carinulata]
MDQLTAKRLLSEGAFFILLDVPEGTEFGIDMKSWNTGEKFRGVKMIPPGIHYIFFSSVSNTGDVAPRIGFFKTFRKSEVLVKKWDKVNECISKEEVSEDEVVRIKENILLLDNFLGPYPYDIHEKWNDLTSCITTSLVEAISPVSGYVQSALELESCSDAERPRGKRKSENNKDCDQSSPKTSRLTENTEHTFLPNLKIKEGTELRLTAFPARTYPENSTPSEVTKHSLDHSYVLDQMISKYTISTEILGEMQICYICFLVGHSLEAFEQWKKLFNLFCSCEIGIKKHIKLYDIFISIAEIHIQEIPEEFIADIVTNSNFAYVKLKQLYRAVKDANVNGQFKTKMGRFIHNLTTKYQWDFDHLDSEDEDEAPVIVEI